MAMFHPGDGRCRILTGPCRPPLADPSPGGRYWNVVRQADCDPAAASSGAGTWIIMPPPM
jgi:hypothetical protein